MSDPVARWFEQWLQRQHPGTVWEVVGERPQLRDALETTPGEIVRPEAGGVGDEDEGIAA